MTGSEVSEEWLVRFANRFASKIAILIPTVYLGLYLVVQFKKKKKTPN